MPWPWTSMGHLPQWLSRVRLWWGAQYPIQWLWGEDTLHWTYCLCTLHKSTCVILYHKLSLLNFREFIFHCSLDPRKYFNDEIFQNYGTSDVTVDYSVPLPCALVSFPRVRTLATLGAVGDDELLDLQLQKHMQWLFLSMQHVLMKLLLFSIIVRPTLYICSPSETRG